jgi:probable phosphoglycerate mutase
MPLFPPEKSHSATDWIHAHCDGGSRGNPGPAGYGALVTDAQGQTLAELSEFLGIRTNNFAEYSGLLAVLAYALENKHPRLKVVSDSELMVKQIQGKYKVNSPDLKPLWQEARNRIAKLDAFEISHALRHKNKEADALANQAMDRGMKRPGASGGSSSGSAVQSLPLRPIPAARGATQAPAASAVRIASPYPGKADAPPDPYAANRKPELAPGVMHRGFTRDGVIHLLGGATLPDGVFVKIIRE